MSESVREAGSQGFTLLAVSSGGGHWEELMLLRPAFAGLDITDVRNFIFELRQRIQKAGISEYCPDPIDIRQV